MDDIKYFSPYVGALFSSYVLVCLILGFTVSIADGVLISLAAIPAKILYDFFREF